jgi:hypothetical protein
MARNEGFTGLEILDDTRCTTQVILGMNDLIIDTRPALLSQPSTLNLASSTLNLKPYTLNPKI